jgi:hypothetical protein
MTAVGNKDKVKNGNTVKTHHTLSKTSESEIRNNPSQVLANADRGIQTAVLSKDGERVVAVVGLNGIRYLPDPNPDPLDEVLRVVLESGESSNK